MLFSYWLGIRVKWVSFKKCWVIKLWNIVMKNRDLKLKKIYFFDNRIKSKIKIIFINRRIFIRIYKKFRVLEKK